MGSIHGFAHISLIFLCLHDHYTPFLQMLVFFRIWPWLSLFFTSLGKPCNFKDGDDGQIPATSPYLSSQLHISNAHWSSIPLSILHLSIYQYLTGGSGLTHTNSTCYNLLKTSPHRGAWVA